MNNLELIKEQDTVKTFPNNFSTNSQYRTTRRQTTVKWTNN